DGMSAACKALSVPVISGNVSLYNETEGSPIPPTPVIGVLGVIENTQHHARASLRPGQQIWLLGPLQAALAGSEYATHCHGWEERPLSLTLPREGGGDLMGLDLDLERRVQDTVCELVGGGIVPRATDVSEGALE